MFIMKKLLSCLLAFCLLCGLGIYNINSSMPVKANDTNIEMNLLKVKNLIMSLLKKN